MITLVFAALVAGFPAADKDTPVLRRVAKFSLGANLQRHKKLVELIQKHRKERGAGSEKVLGELILE